MSKTFYFSEFSGEGTAEKLNAAMAVLKDNPGSTLVIEPGEYLLTTELARQAQANVMSGAWGKDPQPFMFNPDYKYSVGMDFSGHKDTTVIANGVKFIVDGFMEIVSMSDCEGTTIEGLTIDHKRKPFSVGTIKNCTTVSETEAYFDVELDEGFEIQPGTPIGMRYFVYNPHTERLEWPDLYAPHGKYIDERTVRYTGKWLKKNIDGWRYYIWHTYHSRPAILFQRAKNVTVKNVTVHSHPGMGITGNRTENILVDGFRDIPAEGFHMSTNTDATHYTACSGDLIMRNCQFIAQGDDATNVHGYYHMVIAENNGRYTVRNDFPDGIAHTQTQDYPDVGDTLEINDHMTLTCLGTRKVLEVKRLNNRECELLLDAPLPGDPVADKTFVFNVSKLPRLELYNNLCKGNFARGFLCKTRDIYIHDNIFEDIMGTAVCVYAEHSWREGTFSRDVRVENNIIRRCGHLGDDDDSVSGIELGIFTEEPPAEPQIKNVAILNNSIDCPNTGKAISVKYVDGLTVKGNVNHSCKQTLDISSCKNVTVSQ